MLCRGDSAISATQSTPLFKQGPAAGGQRLALVKRGAFRGRFPSMSVYVTNLNERTPNTKRRQVAQASSLQRSPSAKTRHGSSLTHRKESPQPAAAIPLASLRGTTPRARIRIGRKCRRVQKSGGSLPAQRRERHIPRLAESEIRLARPNWAVTLNSNPAAPRSRATKNSRSSLGEADSRNCQTVIATRVKPGRSMHCEVASPGSDLTRISDLNARSEPSDVRHHQYSCGCESDDDAPEVKTQWVIHKISPFSSPSTLRSGSISKVRASLPTVA